MEAAVRHLRDGALPDGSACATCCVLDNLGVVGGALIFRHAVQCFISAMRQGRSQASSVRLVDLTGSLADVATAAGSHPGTNNRQAHGDDAHPRPVNGQDLELIDLYSDPWGWRQEPTKPSMEQPVESANTGGASARPPPPPEPTTSLAALQAELLRPPPHHHHHHHAAGAPPALAPDVGSNGSGGHGGAAAGGGGPDVAPGGSEPAAAGATAGPRTVCVVIGCLSTLMERYGAWQALRLMEAVQRSPVISCVLASMHTDLHPDQLVFALRRLSSCTLDLSPLTQLQTQVAQQALERAIQAQPAASGAAAAGGGGGGSGGGTGGALAGRIDCRTKRRTGRVKVDSELYSILPLQPEAAAAAAAGGGGGGGGASLQAGAAASARLAFHSVPPVLDAPDPKALLRIQPQGAPPAAGAGAAAAGGGGAAAAAAADASPGVGVGAGGQPVGLLGGVSSAEELARAVGSSMRLTLTEEERRAKQQVVLPYQHTGQAHRGGALAAAYAEGDHAGYLPPAAGGTGPAAGGGGQQALGHILYVRDSASEADSDQELDEDLDI